MNRHEDRFSSGQEQYRSNRPGGSHNKSNDYNNRSFDRGSRPGTSGTSDSKDVKVEKAGGDPAGQNLSQADSNTSLNTSEDRSASQKSSTAQNPSNSQQGTKKKFTGRCRLFFGNIPVALTDVEFVNLIKPYGDTEDLFLNAKKGFGFVKMETRAAAEACKNGLDGIELQGRCIRVRFATHSAALHVKNLTAHCTNEALEQAFSMFGEVDRAVVVVDDKGKSQGTGIVEFSRRSAYSKALETVNNGVFLLSKSIRPVSVEPLDQKDEEDGLPERYANKNHEWMEEMSVGPRLAERGSYEYDIGWKWKELEKMEAEKKRALKEEMAQKRLEMELDIESILHEHKANMLRQDMMRRQAELNALESQRRQREEQKLKEIEMRRMQLNRGPNVGGPNAGGPNVGGSSVGAPAAMSGAPGASGRHVGVSPNGDQDMFMRQKTFREMQQFQQGGGGRPMPPPPQPPRAGNNNMEGGGRGGGLLANPDRLTFGNGGRGNPMAQRGGHFDRPAPGRQGGGPPVPLSGPSGMQPRPGAMNNSMLRPNRMFSQGPMGPDPKRPRRF